MTRVIFDIETVGEDFEKLDEISQEYMLRYSETDEDKEVVRQSLGFYPLTGEIVAIGMLNPDTGKGVVYFQTAGEKLEKIVEENVEFIPGTEAEIIKHFWQAIKKYDQFITFNGRTFDCPYIMIRSAIHKIKPTRNLMPYRYDPKEHIDLLDLLTFYGAVRKRFGLHMWCRAFGIKSPKEEGITGDNVKELFKQKKFLEIARYCLGDLQATKELYFYWEKYIKV
ncbi:MAG: ribonuclease H-like domain-containing protein [Candidatus Omnitrophica bacterium]|nr:ribonuclease H-like domain-containing protein [Candidatus Omnitrophota bacterium]MCM8793146.1 ribonuclease H-like domain-containing protein [Candidatus Omnitrophota bacterium]